MTSYLDIIALGIRIEPKRIGPAIDRLGRYAAVNSELGVLWPPGVDPKTLTPHLVAALDERESTISQVLAGTFSWLETTRGVCDTCGQAQEDFYSGMCFLCQATIQRAKKRESKIG